MRKSEIKILYIEFFLLFIYIFNIFVLNFLNDTLMFLFSIFFFLELIILLGFEKDNFRRRKDIILTILIFVICYYMFIYLIGIFLGFLVNGYSLKFTNIVKNIFPIILVQCSKELLRYQINIKGEKNKLLLIISIIVFVLIDISSISFMYNFSKIVDILKLVQTNFIPIVVENILLTYVSIKAGYKASIIYLLLMRLPEYFMPLIPDLGEYLDIIFRIILPALILFTLKTSLEPSRSKSKMEVKHSKFVKVSYFMSLALLLVVIYLTCGIFRYYALTIGSNSMKPKINKGDIVIVEKIKDHSNLEIGDVLVYKKESKVVVHRIAYIEKQDNSIVYTTKGDANNANDNYFVYTSDIIGIVKFKIKYLGYPTVWLSELTS